MWKSGHKFLGQCIEVVNSKVNILISNLASHLVYYEY